MISPLPQFHPCTIRVHLQKSNESPSKSPSPGTKVETPRSPRVPTIATTPKSLGQKSEASGVFFKDQVCGYTPFFFLLLGCSLVLNSNITLLVGSAIVKYAKFLNALNSKQCPFTDVCTIGAQEAMLTIQDNRKEAIDSILPEMDVANVPRWAKVKSKKAETQTEPEGSTNEVPFLNLIVANYRANHSNAPLNTGNTSAAAAPAPA
jgi:hypothetical protein